MEKTCAGCPGREREEQELLEALKVIGRSPADQARGAIAGLCFVDFAFFQAVNGKSGRVQALSLHRRKWEYLRQKGYQPLPVCRI